jgi:hypothetical protein
LPLVVIWSRTWCAVGCRFEISAATSSIVIEASFLRPLNDGFGTRTPKGTIFSTNCTITAV